MLTSQSPATAKADLRTFVAGVVAEAGAVIDRLERELDTLESEIASTRPKVAAARRAFLSLGEAGERLAPGDQVKSTAQAEDRADG